MGNDNNGNYTTGKKIPNTKLEQYEKIFTRAVADSSKKNSSGKDFDNIELFQSMPVFEYSSSIIKRNKEMLELFPDLELGIKIANSSLISPNIMEEEPTRIRLKKDNGAPSLVNSAIANIITGFISNKLNYSQISSIAKFHKGAWVHATIPEVLLDNIIVETIEGTEDDKIDTSKMSKKDRKSFNSLGIFSADSLKDETYHTGLESETDFIVEENKKYSEIEKLLFLDDVVSDDCFSIKNTVSALEDAEKTIKDKLKLLHRKNKKSLTDDEIKKVFSATKRSRDEFVALPATSPSNNKGTSLDLELPVSSCIPIYPAGEPSKHIGYFILINPTTGTPIQDDEFRSRAESYGRAYATGLSSIGSSNDYVSDVLTNFKSKNADETPKIQELDKIYSKLLDLKLKNVLKNSIYGDVVSIDITTNEAYRVMLSRVLEAKQTKMIFLPRELVSYIAFEYRDNGTGKSLLEKIDFYVSSRAVIFYTNIMAKIGNSMSNTRVNAEIDENHPNPKAMRASIMSEYLKSRGSTYPQNVYKHNELAEWSKYSGIQFNIKHPSFGNTDIQIEEVTNDKKEIDIELEEKVTDYIYYTLGVTREQIEASKSEDFATAVASRSKMMANRIREDQNIFTPQISELIKRKVRYDRTTYDQVRTVVETNLNDLKNYLSNLYGEDETKEIYKDKESAIDILTECLIDDTEFFLPKPEVTEDTTKMTQFDNFNNKLDGVLKALISDDTITETSLGNLNINKDDLIKMVKFSATLDYIRSNNVMEYVTDIFTLDNENNALINPIEDYANATQVLAESIMSAKEAIDKVNKKINKKNDKIDAKINAEESTPLEGDDLTVGGGSGDVTEEGDDTGGDIAQGQGDDGFDIGDNPSGENETIPKDGEEIKTEDKEEEVIDTEKEDGEVVFPEDK